MIKIDKIILKDKMGSFLAEITDAKITQQTTKKMMYVDNTGKLEKIEGLTIEATADNLAIASEVKIENEVNKEEVKTDDK